METEKDPRIVKIADDLARGMLRPRPRTCRMWAHYDPADVQKEFGRAADVFIACEYPERPYNPRTLFDADACPACRVWLAAFAVHNPRKRMNADETIRTAMGFGPKATSERDMPIAADLLAHYAATTGDPALVKAVERLATDAAAA